MAENFSNGRAACMVVSDSIYVMVLTADFFAESVVGGRGVHAQPQLPRPRRSSLELVWMDPDADVS